MRNKKTFYWSLVACLIINFSILTSSQASAATRHVPGAFATIQAAIDAAADGDIVLVDDGIYTENINFRGRAITVKSVNGPEVTTIDGGGIDRVVTFNNNEPPETVLDGFTITNGKGGILCQGDDENSDVGDGPSPTITNCVITGNTAAGPWYAKGNGGGIQIKSSSPIINNCTIKNNSAEGCGGGISSTRKSSFITQSIFLTVNNCTISNNSADYGGGIYSEETSLSISASMIAQNNALDGSGGGICCYDNPSTTINNCTIKENSTTRGWGGGMYATRSNFNISNSIISRNVATGISFGGGIAYILGDQEISSVVNCTISHNRGTGIGSQGERSLIVTNSIVWGNTPDQTFHRGLDDGAPLITYSNVQDGYEGEGNIDASPLFVNPASGDYHLSPESPCIDSATPVGAPSEDIEGDIRPQGDGIDMGSDEYSLLGTISGFVTNTDHSPIANVLVKLRQNGALLDETYTSAKGHYEFRNLPAGGYLSLAQKRTYKNNWGLGFVNPNKKWRKNEFINLILTPRN